MGGIMRWVLAGLGANMINRVGRTAVTGLVAMSAFWAVMVCGCDLPRDPKGSLLKARARGFVKVGTHNTDGAIAIRERKVIEAFASRLELDVQWVVGSGEHLLTQLKQFELDLVAGELTESNPWSDHVGFSQPWFVEEGSDRKYVVAVAPGENRLLTELDRFIIEQGR